MNLLGLELQKAGVPFLFAQVRHFLTPDGGVRRLGTIVCRRPEDAVRARAWRDDAGCHEIVVRVATPDELQFHWGWLRELKERR